MEKIAVCLPSYNEKDNIQKITKLVDESLLELGDNYDCCIVNCDNCSPDKTADLFMKTETYNKKYSIISHNIGKGFNIINFMNYCSVNKVDYAFMFDTDLTSFKKDWIKKYLEGLKSSDFVIPLYKRKRYEGNTTNHFIFPVIYALYGVFIRQPIGGDYGFTKKYIEIFNSIIKPEYINSYGIDIFMLLLALEKVVIKQIELGEKRHSLSDSKKINIFKEVLISFTYSYKYYNKINSANIKNNSCRIKNFNSISNEVDANFYYRNQLNFDGKYSDAYKMWKNLLLNYVSKIKYCDLNKLNDELINGFDLYTILFWYNFRFSSSIECENQIYKLAEELKFEWEVMKNANN